MRTPIGVVGVAAVDVVDTGGITPADAVAAGYASLDELHAELDRHGPVCRIALRLAGHDPRVALRADSDLDDPTRPCACRTARSDRQVTGHRSVDASRPAAHPRSALPRASPSAIAFHRVAEPCSVDSTLRHPAAADHRADSSPMSLLLIGANPGVLLWADGERSAFASVWTVDWSVRGAGRALVLWLPGEVRILGSHRELAVWLADSFTRHFPELAGLPWPDPSVVETDVEVDVDLARGVRASAGDVDVFIEEPLDRRLSRMDDFDLGGTPHGLTTVFTPCRTGRITVGGNALPGEPRLSGDVVRPSSSAYLAPAEVWFTVP